MDPQNDAKYIGIGLTFESLVTAIGGFRALAQQQAVQLQEKDAKIKELEEKLAALTVTSESKQA